MTNMISEDCPTRNCDFNFDWTTGQIGCTSGSGSCFTAHLLEAEMSEFHDDKLMSATQRINQILDSVRDDIGNRKLSFVKTRQGILLSWVHHGLDVCPPDAVTAESDDATIALALHLKPTTDRNEESYDIIPLSETGNEIPYTSH